jgi:hypothetical protein
MQSIQKIATQKIPLENIINLLLNINLPHTTQQYLLDKFDRDTSCISKEYFTILHLQLNQTNKLQNNNNKISILEKMIDLLDNNKIYVDLE